MWVRLGLVCWSIWAMQGAVVLDRTAVIVGKRVVKTSDIDRDLRVSEFLNGQPLDMSLAARKKSADRLVEQELIRRELELGGYAAPTAADVDALLQGIRRDRFRGSDQQLRAALERYGLTVDKLREQLLWQLTVLRFIDQRFRAGILVTDEDVRAWYSQHINELKKENPGNSSLEAVEPKIRQSLEGERVNQAFGEWLDQTRRRTRVAYKQEAFQ